MRLRDASKTLNYDTKKKAVDQEAKLTKKETVTGSEWKEKVEEPKKSKYLIYLTIGTFLFFVTAIAVAYFVRYAGIDRTVSTSKITIATQGTTTADSGLTVPLTIRIANRNPVSTQSTTLIITYPSGTYKKEKETITRLRREEFALEEVRTGEIINKHITPIFYGKSGEKKEIMYELEYHIPGVAQPAKIKSAYEILLRTSPVLISKPQYTNPIAGKEVTFTVNIQSNSPDVLPMTYVELLYPIGFTPNQRGFTPNPSNLEGTRWEFPKLKPGDKKTIRVSGTIRGKEGESQAISANIMVSPTGSPAETVEIAAEEEILVIGKAFLNVNLKLNNQDTEKIIVSPGDTVEGRISWKNQDPAKLRNLIITAIITGTGLDESSISARDGGYFDGVQKQITWDKKSLEPLSSLNVGEADDVSFRFKTLPDRVEFSQAQKYVQVNVSARADRVKTGTTESVKNIAVGKIDLRSVLQVVKSTLYSTSAIKNSGPLPPQVGKTTTYALKYFIKNSGNEISNIQINIPLGRWVEITEVTSGIALNEWEYNEETHTITIRIPSLAANGPQSSRSIELQVAIRPKQKDIGKHIVLARRATYTARDTYVNEKFKGSIGQMTTHITAERTDGTTVKKYQKEITENEK